ncbi:MAG: PIN domain-containing protein [Candidatus Poribacteria bacterium]|nr:PIN domain-containing protein [Candidatus Poribacteria bacterium]
MKRSYADSGVLIAAATADPETASNALRILDDTDREFASSVFVRLEVLPNAIFFQRDDERDYYELFFNRVDYWAHPDDSILEIAYQEACQHGMTAIDALHVVCAASIHADEIITTEKPTKPIHRTRRVHVVTIHPVL